MSASATQGGHKNVAVAGELQVSVSHATQPYISVAFLWFSHIFLANSARQ